MIPVLARLAAFIRLGRPIFLGGGFLLYGMGAAIAAVAGARVDLRWYLLGQLAVTSLQLMTHYANDYFDLEADRANTTPTRWSGGSRVLPGGALPPEVALYAAVFLAAAGGGLILTMALAGAPTTAIAALVLAGVLAWGYSAPPLTLHSTGLGELTTAAVVTVLVPFIGFHLQTPALRGLPVLLAAIVPPALLQFAMLLAIEFPDAAGDAAVGKRTLVVRLGAVRAARVLMIATAAPFLLLPLLAAIALPPAAAIGAAAVAPIALWRVLRVRAGDCQQTARAEALTFWAVALLVATSAGQLAGFLWLLR